MPLFDTLLSVLGIGFSIKQEIKEYLKSKINLEQILGDALEQKFNSYKSRIKPYCDQGITSFDKNLFINNIKKQKIKSTSPEDLVEAILPIFSQSIYTPGQITIIPELQEVYTSIVSEGIECMWSDVSKVAHTANELLIELSKDTNTTVKENQESIKGLHESIKLQHEEIKQVKELFNKISFEAEKVSLPGFNKLMESNPPAVHEFDGQILRNPFGLVRAEDFNHNYEKLANLFQDSPEWESVQSRTDNVFIEGGRGTGKSMLLRRLSIQATLSDYKVKQQTVNLSQIKEDYYGIYIKLIRGVFDQYDESGNLTSNQASLFAQHELNIKIFDAFVDSIEWLHINQLLNFTPSQIKDLINDLAGLFETEKPITTFDDLKLVIKKEIKEINDFYRKIIFRQNTQYNGTANDSVSFVTQLAAIFRKFFFTERKEFRLLILIDEFEALNIVQQKAINTIIKKRLNDLTIKVGVRKKGIKTLDTFTENEPIQTPRDYIPIPLDYDSTKQEYKALLKGICKKRLQDSGYPETDIENFLTDKISISFDKEEIDMEITKLWESGKRKNQTIDAEFKSKYRVTAIHRLCNQKKKDYLYYGFDQYKLLSDGIISNFIELCKFTFHFALFKKQNLLTQPEISAQIQSHSIYYVSERLFDKIDSNVPKVGIQLKNFLTNIGEILRKRLLIHSSEPEANRISILDFEEHSLTRYSNLEKVIEEASTWSVITFNNPDSSMRTKHTSSPREAEFSINRIYCPHLKISPRNRWRVKISATDLEGLLNPNKRNKYYKKISQEVLGETEKNEGQQIQMGLE